MDRKGQVTIGNAPLFILIIGMVFLVMATIALVGEKYQDSVSSGLTGSVINETLTGPVINTTSRTLAGSTHCGVSGCAISELLNGTTSTIAIGKGNYTVTSNCIATFTWDASNYTGNYDTGDLLISYSYEHGGVACNVTGDLQTEIGNNTSLAGLVLTIGLVGLVLTILMGVFYAVGSKGNRV